MAVGYIRHQRGEFHLAEIAFSQAEAVGEPRDAEDAALVGEAVHGIGWARLRRGRLDAAGRTFSFFLRQYSGHPLRVSAQVGALAVEMERLPPIRKNARKPKRLSANFPRRTQGMFKGVRSSFNSPGPCSVKETLRLLPNTLPP